MYRDSAMADVEALVGGVAVAPDLTSRSGIERPQVVRHRDVDDASTKIGVALIGCGWPVWNGHASVISWTFCGVISVSVL